MRIYQIFSRMTKENEVHVIQVANNSESWELDGLKIHNLKPFFGRFGTSLYDSHFFIARYLFAMRVGRAVRRLRPDIADYNSSVFPLFNRKYKMVSTSTLMPTPTAIGSTKSRLILALDKFLLNYKMKRSDFIIYLSKQMQELLADAQKKYGKEGKYVPNGVDQTIFYQKKKDECRKRQDLPPKKFLVMYSSRLVQYKRPFDYLNALKGLPDRYFGVIAGGGPLEEEIRSWIGKNAMNERVKLVGRVEKDTLSDLYAASDVVVYPGEVEIQPLVPQEAMACGTPPIVSDTLGNNEIVTDGENGITVKLGDVNQLSEAIRKVCEYTSVSERLIYKGLEYMKDRNWDVSSSITLNTYHEIMSHSKQ